MSIIPSIKDFENTEDKVMAAKYLSQIGAKTCDLKIFETCLENGANDFDLLWDVNSKRRNSSFIKLLLSKDVVPKQVLDNKTICWHDLIMKNPDIKLLEKVIEKGANKFDLMLECLKLCNKSTYMMPQLTYLRERLSPMELLQIFARDDCPEWLMTDTKPE